MHRTSLLHRTVLALAVVGMLQAVAKDADAGGLYATDRGVRPLGRGGAFVAGADDLGAIWYNPAGLADAGTSILVDFSWVNQTAEHSRRAQVADSGGTIRQVDFPQVKGEAPFLPIPTIAGSYNFGKKKEMTAAFGIYAPYTAVMKWPETVDGQPAPSRYSLVSMEGSALAIIGGSFAYKPVEWFRVGAGLQLLAGNFASTKTFSASPPDRLIGAPEDPAYDSFSKLDVGPIFAPSGNFGMIFAPGQHVRIGLSAQLPFWVNSAATIKVRLPTAAPFDRARQEGDGASVRFRLPPILRAGVELRGNLTPNANLRGEVAYVREFWSLHDTIDIRAEDIKLYDITGFPSPFGVAPISIPRGFQDSNSFRLGGELSLKAGGDTWIHLRSGGSYETSAIPQEYVSTLTYDANKVILSLGGGVSVTRELRLDLVGAYSMMSSTTVDPAAAAIPPTNPVKGNPADTVPINGGDYAARALVMGLGLNYKF